MTDLGLVQIPDPVHTSTDVVLDHTHDDATQVPEAGIGVISLPISGLAGQTAEEVFDSGPGDPPVGPVTSVPEEYVAPGDGAPADEDE